MAERPTQEAQYAFNKAIMQLHANDPNDAGLKLAVASLAEGLGHLAVGLRATYVVLEDVKRLLAAPGPGTHRGPTPGGGGKHGIRL
jgi:hypothetical protein